jgi:hypothetical protein
MQSTLSVIGLLVAQLLPWVCGAVWVRWLLARTGRYNLAIVLGQGFFIGLFLTTLLLRFWDAVGMPFNFVALASVVAALTLLGALLQLKRPGTVVVPVHPPSSPPAPWPLVLVGVLLALVAWRYSTLFQELLLRPLYAWDAWMNWAPKAIVWFHQGTLVDYVSPEAWPTAGADDYTLGNRQAWNYPITVPLIQLWNMLGAGTWDHGGVYLSWLLAPLCLGLALFGHLRLAGVSLPLAAVAAYLLLSMPFLNVHSVLAGYADIWVGAAFALGVCALREWQHTRHWAFAALWLALAALCTQLKVPGIFMALILLGAGLRAWLALPPLVEVGLALVVVLVVAVPIALGVSADIPYFGQLSLSIERIQLGRIGFFEPVFHPIGGVIAETFLELINWHLLGYLVPAILLYGLLRGRLLQSPDAATLATVLAFAFILGVFFFTGYYTQALNYVTLNRAILFTVPAILFVSMLHLEPLLGVRASATATKGN